MASYIEMLIEFVIHMISYLELVHVIPNPRRGALRRAPPFVCPLPSRKKPLVANATSKVGQKALRLKKNAPD